MMKKDYYIILGVNNTASFEEIKTAYRNLAKKYHPDKNLGNKASEEYFKEIQQAYAILSNPEKRKTYDLKFSYTHTYTQQKQNTSYAGNAYRYAQQQAEQKQYETTKKTQPQKPDKTESYQILISVGLALVLLYFIISYSTNDNTVVNPAKTTTNIDSVLNTNKETEQQINNFDSPYSKFFGEEVSDWESKNCIIIHNSNESEVVVCLVQSEDQYKTVRNQYMNRGDTFKMNNIPDGKYFLKIYFGNNWDSKKSFLNNNIKGGFINEIGFIKLNDGKDIFKMKQKKTGNSISFSSYEIDINPYQINQAQNISPEEFFH